LIVAEEGVRVEKEIDKHPFGRGGSWPNLVIGHGRFAARLLRPVVAEASRESIDRLDRPIRRPSNNAPAKRPGTPEPREDRGELPTPATKARGVCVTA
jgi:hypothetical protein